MFLHCQMMSTQESDSFLAVWMSTQTLAHRVFVPLHQQSLNWQNRVILSHSSDPELTWQCEVDLVLAMGNKSLCFFDIFLVLEIGTGTHIPLCSILNPVPDFCGELQELA